MIRVQSNFKLTTHAQQLNSIINMYKIVFVVAVFAFVLQGALSSPVAADNEAAPTFLKSDGSKNVGPAENKAANAVGDTTETTTIIVDETTTTAAPKSGASSTEMCLLLVQVSSLALVAKHMLL